MRNPVIVFCSWIIKKYSIRLQKKGKTKQELEDIKKRKELLAGLRQLYKFVQWLNKNGFANRKIRKNAWYRISRGEALLETTLARLIQNYEISLKPKSSYKVTKGNPFGSPKKGEVKKELTELDKKLKGKSPKEQIKILEEIAEKTKLRDQKDKKITLKPKPKEVL